MKESPLQVRWVRGTDGNFLDLLRLNLQSSYFLRHQYGVFIVWSAGVTQAPVITVGQGDIRDRLAALKKHPVVSRFAESGQLKVSWIIINEKYFDGVEAFLYDYYKPIMGERKRDISSIPVDPLLSL